MAKNTEVVAVPQQEFSLMYDNAELVDLSLAVQQLGWTEPKVKTRAVVGYSFIINDYKKVVNRDDTTQWYYYCACEMIDDGKRFCTILGGQQVKEYLERLWDYNPRARAKLKLGLTQTARGNEVYFIDAP